VLSHAIVGLSFPGPVRFGEAASSLLQFSSVLSAHFTSQLIRAAVDTNASGLETCGVSWSRKLGAAATKGDAEMGLDQNQAMTVTGK
jgi:hypothetical protein